MSKYWCKCGRVVSKSTNASTTGNRDTESCTGCPYLLTYGPNTWDSGKKAFVQDVQGYECRMTDHPLDYTTHISSLGGPNDKTVLHVESLDFDFLDAITEWVNDTFTEGELAGGFKRNALRASEFMDGYRVTFYPSQNKKGVAAKQQLFHRFFHSDGTRIDMTPEEEKAKVLADIESGKAAAQGREKAKMKGKEQKEEIIPCTQEQIDSVLLHIPLGYTYAEAFHKVCREAKDRKAFDTAMLDSEMCNLMFNRDNLYIDKDNTLHCDHDVAGVHFYAGERMSYLLFSAVLDNLWGQAQKYKAFIGETVTGQEDLSEDEQDGTCPEPITFADLGLSELCIKLLTEDYVFDNDDLRGLHGLLPSERRHLQEAYPEDWKKIYAYLWPAGTETNDCTSAKSSDTENPTPTDDLPWSAAATAAADQPAESPVPADAGNTAANAANESADQELAEKNAAVISTGSQVAETAFNYGVDPETNEQLIQCAQTYMMGKMAMVMAVKRAHSLTANHKNGTFGKWCASVGISRDKGNQLVNIADNFGNIEIDGKPLVEIAPISLLAEAAKPSTPAVVRESVAHGDITTHKQYKALEKQLAEERELRRQAKRELEESERLADDEIARVQRIADDANDRANTAEAKVKELESRPIEVTGADATDIARWRAEGAEQAREEQADAIADLQERLDVAENAQGNVVDALYIMVQQIAENCAAQLDNWSKAAACLTDEAYMDCVQQLDSLRIQILRMMMEGAGDDEMP